MSNLKLNLPPTHEERKLAQQGFQQLITLMDEINHPEMFRKSPLWKLVNQSKSLLKP